MRLGELVIIYAQKIGTLAQPGEFQNFRPVPLMSSYETYLQIYTPKIIYIYIYIAVYLLRREMTMIERERGTVEKKT